MALVEDYAKSDGLGLAELVRSGQVRARELAEVAIARIESLNPRLNAVVTPLFEQALKAAEEPLSGPFAGVPFLLKDLEPMLAGARQTMGSRAFRDFQAPWDNEYVVRARRAGLLFLGKTNCPEFGLMGTTEPELFGPTRNPWNPAHSSGGSSGGSAAAVAAGMVPLASGGDGGGSIRIPASCCGIFGLKPSRGRTPNGPLHGEIWCGAVAGLGLSRSVRDSAALLDAIAGADCGAPYEIRPPERPYLEEVRRERRFRIGFTTASPLGNPVDPQVRNSVIASAKLLAGLGHEVEEAEPAYDAFALARAFMVLLFGEVDAQIRTLGTYRGRKIDRHEVEVSTWTLGLLGRAVSAGDFVFARTQWNKAARVLGAYFEKYDLYLSPVMAVLPPRLGEMLPKPFEILALRLVNLLRLERPLKWSGVIDKMIHDKLTSLPYTMLANLTGVPAMSLPLSLSREGLPIGMMVTAAFGGEDRLFNLAGQLERAGAFIGPPPTP